MNGDHHPVGSPSAESGRAELLACPFCCNPPDYEHTESEASIYCSYEYLCHGASVRIESSEHGGADPWPIAIAAWNRRTPDRALLERIEALEAAVAPFAAVGDIFEVRAGNSPNDDDDPITEWTDHRVGSRLITVGDFRRARKALSGEKQ